jgi:hypothetical protein
VDARNKCGHHKGQTLFVPLIVGVTVDRLSRDLMELIIQPNAEDVFAHVAGDSADGTKRKA